MGRHHQQLGVLHVHERHHHEVVRRIRRGFARGSRLLAAEVAVAERRGVAMVPVGDEYLLVGESVPHRGREVRVGDRPQDALDPVGVYGG